MKKITIVIDRMDNAAFVENVCYNDSGETEAVRIIREIANKIEQGQRDIGCRDYNGNTVGAITIE